MEEYDFSIEHRPRERHGNADGLSRKPCPKKECLCKDKPNDNDEQHISIGPVYDAILTSVSNRSVTKLHVSASPVIQEQRIENEEKGKV